MDMVVYNGRLYVAPVLVVVVGRVYMYNGVGGGGLDRGFYNGELYADAGRGVFGCTKLGSSVYDGEDLFLISRWDEFGAGVQVVCPFLRFSNN
jgi:hypothetical protein